VRQQVEEIIGQGQQAPSGHIPFTPRARKVLELSLREALQLGHNCIGTEHILLGLIREGEGVAAQVLVKLGADLTEVRQHVIKLLGPLGEESGSTRVDPRQRAERRSVNQDLSRLDAIDARLSAVEQRVGTGPDTGSADQAIEHVRSEKHVAVGAQEYERAASLRDQEKELLAQKAVRQQEWAAAHPGLPALAGTCQQLSNEIKLLRGLLHQHGIDPEDRAT